MYALMETCINFALHMNMLTINIRNVRTYLMQNVNIITPITISAIIAIPAMIPITIVGVLSLSSLSSLSKRLLLEVDPFSATVLKNITKMIT